MAKLSAPTVPCSASRHSTFEQAAAVSPTTITSTPTRTPSDDMLQDVLAASGIALWESWDHPLELISFTAGDGAWPLSPLQVAPGTLWEENIYPADRGRLHRYLRQSGPLRERGSVDYRLIVGDGELAWVRHWTLNVHVSTLGRPRLRNAIMSIAEQKQLEWECLRVSERECNRIGQELHDDLCQVLAGIGFMMRLLQQRARPVDGALAAEIDDLNNHLSVATDRVRSMAHGLFPAQLHFKCLRDALAGFATEARTFFRIDLKLDFQGPVPRHNSDQIIHVYRIVQESVSNAVRHGRATAVHVRVAGDAAGMHIEVTDDGAGFVPVHSRAEGIGMHVMQYRARILGGILTALPAEPHGVRIVLEYPPANDSFPNP